MIVMRVLLKDIEALQRWANPDTADQADFDMGYHLRSLSKHCAVLGLRGAYALVEEKSRECDVYTNLLQALSSEERKRACVGPASIRIDAAFVNEFITVARAELKGSWFLSIPVERERLYSDPAGWFGQPLIDRFPDIDKDVRGACQCSALGQWTASVFHSMRILEHGLRWIAKELQIPCAENVKYEEWGKILREIFTKIDEIQAGGGKGDEKAARLSFFAEAATYLRYFKNAYRNDVSHSRGHYDDEDARNALDNVRRFMNHIVTKDPAVKP
jgi:hypothetical protein